MTLPIRGDHPPIDDELLSAYLDGQVSPAEHATVETAIAADPALRQRARDLRATVSLLRSLPQPAPRRTFILTPEQAAAIRPARVAWFSRLFPTVAAVSAVAAVLCLALVVGDLATGGFSTKQPAPAPRSAAESVTFSPTTAVAAVATAVSAPVVGNAPVVATARSVGAAAPAASGAQAPVLPAPTATVLEPAATATIVANAQPAPAVSAPASVGGATVTKETHRVSVTLVRTAEILLGLLAVAGIGLAVVGWRGRPAGARAGNR